MERVGVVEISFGGPCAFFSISCWNPLVRAAVPLVDPAAPFQMTVPAGCSAPLMRPWASSAPGLPEQALHRLLFQRSYQGSRVRAVYQQRSPTPCLPQLSCCLHYAPCTPGTSSLSTLILINESSPVLTGSIKHLLAGGVFAGFLVSSSIPPARVLLVTARYLKLTALAVTISGFLLALEIHLTTQNLKLSYPSNLS